MFYCMFYFTCNRSFSAPVLYARHAGAGMLRCGFSLGSVACKTANCPWSLKLAWPYIDTTYSQSRCNFVDIVEARRCIALKEAADQFMKCKPTTSL